MSEERKSVSPVSIVVQKDEFRNMIIRNVSALTFILWCESVQYICHGYVHIAGSGHPQICEVDYAPDPELCP